MTNSCLKQGGFKPPFPVCWEPWQATMAWESNVPEYVLTIDTEEGVPVRVTVKKVVS